MSWQNDNMEGANVKLTNFVAHVSYLGMGQTLAKEKRVNVKFSLKIFSKAI